MLIVCEGEKTEPNYINGLIKSLNKDFLSAELVGEGYNTTSLVERAKVLANNGSYGNVWVVFDKDSFSQFDEAIENAEKHGYNVAYSNQAFELWYLLHFYFIDSALNRSLYKAKIEEAIRERSNDKDWRYNKNDHRMFDLISKYGNEQQAIARAKKLVSNNGTANPSTTVYKLVNYLRTLKP